MKNELSPERHVAQIVFDTLIRAKFLNAKEVDFVHGINLLEEELKYHTKIGDLKIEMFLMD